MSTTFEEEEDLNPPIEGVSPQDRELTLSSTSLLGIFFGLVLLCGLFFAFGYTLGRRSMDTVAEAATTTSGATTPAQAPGAHAKPSPSSPAPVRSAPEPAPPMESDVAQATVPENTPAATLPDTKPQAAPDRTPAKSKAPASPQPAKSAAVQPATPTTMVQIAAISNPADADVLIGALRKRGYSVTVRHESTDSLLHVQVGPFATRAEACAMRQKLLADGYNAILK